MTSAAGCCRQSVDERLAAVLGGITGWPREGVRFADVSGVGERRPDIFQALVARMCDLYADSPPLFA